MTSDVDDGDNDKVRRAPEPTDAELQELLRQGISQETLASMKEKEILSRIPMLVSFYEVEPNPSMPQDFVKYVRQLWCKQIIDASALSLYFEVMEARLPKFRRLITCEHLSEEIKKAYCTPAGPRIVERLARSAVSVPELHELQDRRPIDKRLANIRQVRRGIDKLLLALERDRGKLRKGKKHGSIQQVTDDELHPIGSPTNIRSEPIRQTCRPKHGPKVGTVRLTLFDLDVILRSFIKPINQAINEKFRNVPVDDPLVPLGQVAKGWSKIPHAALVLDSAIDGYEEDLKRATPRLSRDRLVSAFVEVAVPNQVREAVGPKAINSYCRARRKTRSL